MLLFLYCSMLAGGKFCLKFWGSERDELQCLNFISPESMSTQSIRHDPEAARTFTWICLLTQCNHSEVKTCHQTMQRCHNKQNTFKYGLGIQ